MSFAEALAASSLRAFTAAVLAWLVALAVTASPARRTVITGLCAVWAMPGLVFAYAWSSILLAAELGPPTLAAAHAVLLALRTLPAAALVLWFAPPPPATPSSLFTLRGVSRWRLRWMWCVHGPGRRHLLALCLGFVLAFQEFELASLLGQAAWTVWLFDAQAGGLEFSSTLARCVGPVVIEMAVLALGFGGLRGSVRHGPAAMRAEAGSARRTGPWWVAAATVVVVGVPVLHVVSEARGELIATLVEARLFGEIAASLAFAGIAVAVAMTAAASIAATRRPVRAALIVCLPGLAGALVVGLGLQGLFHALTPAWLYDSPVPVVVALSVLSLPAAMLLGVAFGTARPGAEIHAARLLRTQGTPAQRRAGAGVLAVLVGRRRLLVAGLLFVPACFEVVASSLLAPVAMTPASVRLYNLMHYGHGAALSAMVTIMTGLPLVVVGLVAAFFRRG